jgi:4-amino-4-deoxy-L-arabinose transferase
MNDIVFGIFTVLFCTAGYYLSWRQQARNNFSTALWLLMACGLLLRIYTASDLFLHEWDERYHALVAKNMMDEPFRPMLYKYAFLPHDYRDWGSTHIWMHKQPLPLWTMAISMKLFGVNEIAMRLPSVLLTTIGIGLIFYIASYLFSKKVGYLAALFYSINGLIIEMSAGRVPTDHIDSFFLFFVELAIFFTIVFARRQHIVFSILAGASIGAAILCKWLPALIVLPVWLLLLRDKLRTSQLLVHFTVLLAVCIAVFLPWQLYIFDRFPIEAEWESAYNVRHIFESLGHREEPFYFFLNQVRINYGELIYLPIGWYIYLVIKNKRDYKRLALVLWFAAPFLFFSFTKTKMQGYLLFTAPALFIMTADIWHQLKEHRESSRMKWLVNLLLVAFIALPVRYCIERVKPFDNHDRNPQWAEDLKQLNKQNIKRGILLHYPRPVEAMFYTDLAAHQYLPAASVITGFVNQGYKVLIHGQVPEEIREIPGVTMVNLSE